MNNLSQEDYIIFVSCVLNFKSNIKSININDIIKIIFTKIKIENSFKYKYIRIAFITSKCFILYHKFKDSPEDLWAITTRSIFDSKNSVEIPVSKIKKILLLG